jgi:hypothetical protein
MHNLKFQPMKIFYNLGIKNNISFSILGIVIIDLHTNCYIPTYKK